MSAVTIKKPYGCWDKGPPEPLSEPLTAAAPLTFPDAVERMSIIIQNRI